MRGWFFDVPSTDNANADRTHPGNKSPSTDAGTSYGSTGFGALAGNKNKNNDPGPKAKMPQHVEGKDVAERRRCISRG